RVASSYFNQTRVLVFKLKLLDQLDEIRRSARFLQNAHDRLFELWILLKIDVLQSGERFHRQRRLIVAAPTARLLCPQRQCADQAQGRQERVKLSRPEFHS